MELTEEIYSETEYLFIYNEKDEYCIKAGNKLFGSLGEKNKCFDIGDLFNGKLFSCKSQKRDLKIWFFMKYEEDEIKMFIHKNDKIKIKTIKENSSIGRECFTEFHYLSICLRRCKGVYGGGIRNPTEDEIRIIEENEFYYFLPPK